MGDLTEAKSKLGCDPTRSKAEMTDPLRIYKILVVTSEWIFKCNGDGWFMNLLPTGFIGSIPCVLKMASFDQAGNNSILFNILIVTKQLLRGRERESCSYTMKKKKRIFIEEENKQLTNTKIINEKSKHLKMI